MSPTETKGIALITGASSGIGAVYADRLVRAAPPELRSEHGLVVAKDDVLGRSIAWRIPLIVEDQEDLAEAIAGRLQKRGYAVDIAMDGSEADELLRRENYQLVVLDLILPGFDGKAVLQELRRRRSMIPVLVLTARSEVEDKVSVLDIGADDYLVKPFDFRELEARCRALLRRRHGMAASTVRFGNLVFDAAARGVTVADQPVALTGREFRLLELLLANLGCVLSKDMLIDGLFGLEEAVCPNTIELYISRLRRKLDGATVHIRTLRGMGYVAELASHIDGRRPELEPGP